VNIALLGTVLARRGYFRLPARVLGRIGRITLAALGPRIAAAAGEAWTAVHTASRPDEAALLALAVDLCQKTGSTPVPPAGQP